MRLLIVTNYPPSTQNLSEYAYNLVNEFKKIKKNNKIIVLANSDGNYQKLEKSDDKVEIIRCWKNVSTLSLLNIIKYLKIIDPDLVYFNISMTTWGNSKTINLFGALIPLLSRLMGHKVVSTLHNILEITELNKIKYIPNSNITRLGASIATRFILTKYVQEQVVY